jgi:hypothetical protein
VQVQVYSIMVTETEELKMNQQTAGYERSRFENLGTTTRTEPEQNGTHTPLSRSAFIQQNHKQDCCKLYPGGEIAKDGLREEHSQTLAPTRTQTALQALRSFKSIGQAIAWCYSDYVGGADYSDYSERAVIRRLR